MQVSLSWDINYNYQSYDELDVKKKLIKKSCSGKADEFGIIVLALWPASDLGQLWIIWYLNFVMSSLHSDIYFDKMRLQNNKQFDIFLCV